MNNLIIFAVLILYEKHRFEMFILFYLKILSAAGGSSLDFKCTICTINYVNYQL